VEEAGDRLERPRVRLRLPEEPEHRLGADQSDAEPVVVVARAAVRAQEVDSRDRPQLAGAAVEHHLDVRERLETPSEARLRLADPFRDRAEAARGERVEVQDAVGLPEPERAENDRLRLLRPSRHPASSLELRPGGNGCGGFGVTTGNGKNSDLYDNLVRLLRPGEGAARLEGPRVRRDPARRRSRLPAAALRPDRRLDGPADPHRRLTDRRLQRAAAARPRRS